MILVFKKILGVIFFIIGAAGLFLPLLPGVLFLVIALSLLGMNKKLGLRLAGSFETNGRISNGFGNKVMLVALTLFFVLVFVSVGHGQM
jgi:hypothetical protein